MLDANIKQQLKTYLQMLRHPIELVASLDNSDKARDMEQLVQEIAECSDRVSVRLDGDYNLRPSFSIAKQGEEGRVRFAGLPMGHEFTSLLLGLLQLALHVGVDIVFHDPAFWAGLFGCFSFLAQ